MLTMIMDSGANINLFKNKELLENLTTSPFNHKKIRGVNGKSECFKKGSLNRSLGDLPLPKDDYYYSPDSMANILSLALISKTNRVYMDTAIDNAFYVFDGEGKYLRFHLYRSTNLYRLDVEQTNDGATIFTTIEGCETTKQRRKEMDEQGLSRHS